MNLTLFPQPPKSPAGGKVFFLHLPFANQNPQMNPSPAISNTESGIKAGDALLWGVGIGHLPYTLEED
jgi:hypothetical protein